MHAWRGGVWLLFLGLEPRPPSMRAVLALIAAWRQTHVWSVCVQCMVLSMTWLRCHQLSSLLSSASSMEHALLHALLHAAALDPRRKLTWISLSDGGIPCGASDEFPGLGAAVTYWLCGGTPATHIGWGAAYPGCVLSRAPVQPPARNHLLVEDYGKLTYQQLPALLMQIPCQIALYCIVNWKLCVQRRPAMRRANRWHAVSVVCKCGAGPCVATPGFCFWVLLHSACSQLLAPAL